ncbi:hypothetical protein XENOCAPTIV_011909 [Xenoophorus captivus]|uniref:Uncharacterized protein n=1 Tax=Xenoophorus captivus TaxID=1517983 RepID=A0ABV0RGX8_9TELE
MSKNVSQAYVRSQIRPSFSSAISTSCLSKLGTRACETRALTFLCKSNRGLESQNPVLAIVTAGGRVPVPGPLQLLTAGFSGGLRDREEPCCPERR